MNAYSEDLRKRAIELYKSSNYTQLEICNLLKISCRTMTNWLSLYRKTGDWKIAKPARVGRTRKFDDKELVLSYLELNPDASGKVMREALAPEISDTAFYNSLSRMGITYKKKR